MSETQAGKFVRFLVPLVTTTTKRDHRVHLEVTKTMTKTHRKTNTKTKTDLSIRKSSCIHELI